MKSLSWSFFLIAVAILLNECQLTTASPTGIRSGNETSNKEEPISIDEDLLEDPIIDETLFSMEDGRKLHPRMKPMQKIKIDKRGGNNRIKPETPLQAKIINESLHSDSILKSEKVLTKAKNEEKVNASNAKNETPKRLNKTTEENIENQFTRKDKKNTLEFEKDTNNSSNASNEEANDNLINHENDTNDVKSSLKRKIQVDKESDIELAGASGIEVSSRIAIDSLNSLHNNNLNNSFDQNDSESTGEKENGVGDEFLFKHNHLANLLFHSSSFGLSSSNKEDSKQSSEQTTSHAGAENLARMVKETQSEAVGDKDNEFKARSDTEIPEERSSHESKIDRLLQIDASDIEEHIHVDPIQSDETSNEVTADTSTKHNLEKEKSKGFFNFLKSLFVF